MPATSRKRRLVANEAVTGHRTFSEDEVPHSTRQRRRRRDESALQDVSGEPSDSGDNDGLSSPREDMDIDDEDEDAETQDQLVKKLVRYALACEYSRQPIRRDGIREKVFGKHKASFKHIFDAAQTQLRAKFGMEMTELPQKEKVTLKDRRAAQKAQNAKMSQKSQFSSSQATVSSKTYIVTSTLPSAYRAPAILAPSVVPTTAEEASYIALYTTIIALISLSGGTLAEPKLERYLKRLNADVNMPHESKTEVGLQKMIKQGYLIKVKDNSGGEEITEWMVGPRGKIEVGNRGIKGLVAAVYGDSAPEDLADRVKSSLGLEAPGQMTTNQGTEVRQDTGENEQANNAGARMQGRRRRNARENDD